MADRLTQALEAFVRKVVRAAARLSRAYPSRVVKQNADGTLELVPDDAKAAELLEGADPVRRARRLRDHRRRRARLLEFAGADPQKPIATVWESASVTLLDRHRGRDQAGRLGATEALVLGTTYATQMNALRGRGDHAADAPAGGRGGEGAHLALAARPQGDVSTNKTT
jgi:hypothetical protein